MKTKQTQKAALLFTLCLLIFLPLSVSATVCSCAQNNPETGSIQNILDIGELSSERDCDEACQAKKNDSAATQVGWDDLSYFCYPYSSNCKDIGSTEATINPPLVPSATCHCAESHEETGKPVISEKIPNISTEKACDEACQAITNYDATYYCYPTTESCKDIGTTDPVISPVPTSLSSGSTTKYTYTPMEEIPGFGRPNSDATYIMALYQFGLWTVGIAAILMISVGAFMYITSAGNTSTMGKAKEIIFDSIIGVILALTSYLLLNTINPAFVSISTSQTGSAGSPGTIGGPSGTTKGYAKACPDPSSTTPIDFSKATNDSDIKLSSTCDKYDFSNTYDVPSCLLRAMAQMESSCGSNKGPSSAHACGLMQLLPETATTLAGREITCEELINNDTLSIELAAKYTSQNFSSSCVGGKEAAIFAGYNSGYGCGTSACSPQKHALCDSGAVDEGGCGTGKAYECCVSPGGLEESINYAWNGIGLYNQCEAL